MKRLVLLLLPAAGLAFAATAPVPQGASPAASAASAPAAPSGRRPLSPEALRDSGTFPDDLQPEATRPQIRVPLGRTPPAPAAAASAAVRPAPVDDSVARCKAQPGAAQREACLRALAPRPAASSPG